MLNYQMDHSDPTHKITFSDVLITMRVEGKRDQARAIERGTPIKRRNNAY